MCHYLFSYILGRSKEPSCNLTFTFRATIIPSKFSFHFNVVCLVICRLDKISLEHLQSDKSFLHCGIQVETIVTNLTRIFFISKPCFSHKKCIVIQIILELYTSTVSQIPLQVHKAKPIGFKSIQPISVNHS